MDVFQIMQGQVKGTFPIWFEWWALSSPSWRQIFLNDGPYELYLPFIVTVQKTSKTISAFVMKSELFISISYNIVQNTFCCPINISQPFWSNFQSFFFSNLLSFFMYLSNLSLTIPNPLQSHPWFLLCLHSHDEVISDKKIYFSLQHMHTLVLKSRFMAVHIKQLKMLPMLAWDHESRESTQSWKQREGEKERESPPSTSQCVITLSMPSISNISSFSNSGSKEAKKYM